MNPRAILLSFFGLGMILQSAGMAWQKSDQTKRWFVIAMPFLLAAVIGPIAWAENHYDAYGVAAGITLVFPWAFISLYAREALPPIDERIVFSHTATAWCAAALVLTPEARHLPAAAGELIRAHPLSMGCAALGSALIAACATARTTWGTTAKVFQYSWFLATVAFLGFLQLSFGDLAFFMEFEPAGPAAILSAFAAGMAVFYLLSHLYFLLMLVMLWQEQENKAERRLFRDYADQFAAHFADRRCSWAEAAAIVAFNVCVVGARYRLRAVPGSLFADAALLLSPVMIRWALSDKSAPRRLKGHHSARWSPAEVG